MSTTYRSRTRDQRIADESGEADDGGSPLPCRGCGDLTPRSVLAHLGARCSRCYASFCRGDLAVSRDYERELGHADKMAILKRMRSTMATVGRGNAQNPKAWALALKVREEAGERLSPAQRSMWRAALGPYVASENLTGRD